MRFFLNKAVLLTFSGIQEFLSYFYIEPTSCFAFYFFTFFVQSWQSVSLVSIFFAHRTRIKEGIEGNLSEKKRKFRDKGTPRATFR